MRETEAPAIREIGRRTATPSRYGKRASPRLYFVDYALFASPRVVEARYER